MRTCPSVLDCVYSCRPRAQRKVSLAGDLMAAVRSRRGPAELPGPSAGVELGVAFSAGWPCHDGATGLHSPHSVSISRFLLLEAAHCGRRPCCLPGTHCVSDYVVSPCTGFDPGRPVPGGPGSGGFASCQCPTARCTGGCSPRLGPACSVTFAL